MVNLDSVIIINIARKMLFQCVALYIMLTAVHATSTISSFNEIQTGSLLCEAIKWQQCQSV